MPSWAAGTTLRKGDETEVNPTEEGVQRLVLKKKNISLEPDRRRNHYIVVSMGPMVEDMILSNAGLDHGCFI